ncbi:hypothetical protein Ancab_024938 [Ancistrocladus abbreviatus]
MGGHYLCSTVCRETLNRNPARHGTGTRPVLPIYSLYCPLIFDLLRKIESNIAVLSPPLNYCKFFEKKVSPSSPKMAVFRPCFMAIFLLVVLLSLHLVLGLRFVIDREECFSQKVEYDWDTVHASFVVIKYDSSWQTEHGVDLVVTGPTGNQIHDLRDKISEKLEFVAHQKGVYRFCFTNKSPYHETIDFDVQVGHFTYHDEHAKDEHLKPLFDQIEKVAEALYNIQFEQHWLEAQTDRQAIINEAMSKRAVHKALFESAALIGASVLQVYLLKRLFERKLSLSRV